MARYAKDPRVMRKVNVARGAKLAKGFQMPRVAMGKVARMMRMAGVPCIAKVARDTRVASVGRLARVA